MIMTCQADGRQLGKNCDTSWQKMVKYTFKNANWREFDSWRNPYQRFMK